MTETQGQKFPPAFRIARASSFNESVYIAEATDLRGAALQAVAAGVSLLLALAAVASVRRMASEFGALEAAMRRSAQAAGRAAESFAPSRTWICCCSAPRGSTPPT